MLAGLGFRFSLEYSCRNAHPPGPLAPFPSDFKAV